MREKHLQYAVLVLIVLFVVCQLPELGRVTSLRGDETYYIQGAYTMIQSGDWITPRYESGELRFEKPILTYWFVGVPMRFIGMTRGLWPVRIPALLLTLATLPFVYGLAKVLLRDRIAALFAVVVQLTTSLVYSNAHQGRTDTPLAFFVVAAMFYFARLLFEPGHEVRDALLAYGFTAGAILTKGLAGFAWVLLPIIVFIVFVWKVGRPRLKSVMSLWGILLLILLVAPWFAVVIFRHGGEVTKDFFQDQVTSNVTESKWYLLTNLATYPLVFLQNCLPLSLVVLFGFITGDARMRETFRERRAEWLFLAIWFLVVFVIVIGAASQRGRYLLPVIPAFSVFAGAFFSRLSLPGARPRGTIWALYGLGAIALFVAAALVGYVAWLIAHRWAMPIMAPVCTVAIVAGGAAVLALTRTRGLQAAALCLGATMIVAVCATNVFLTPPAPLKTAQELTLEAVAKFPQGTRVGLVGLQKMENCVLLLYMGRRVNGSTDSSKPQEQVRFVRKFLSDASPAILVMDDQAYATLPDDLRGTLKVVETTSGLGSLDFGAWRKEKKWSTDSLLRVSTVTMVALYRGPG